MISECMNCSLLDANVAKNSKNLIISEIQEKWYTLYPICGKENAIKYWA